MEGSRISKADAILIASGCIAAIFILDGFFKDSLFANSPTGYWAFDLFKHVVLPASALLWLARRYRVTPGRYGIRAVAENETWLHFLGLTVFLAIVLFLVYYVAIVVSWLILQPLETPPFYQSIIPKGLLHYPVVLYFAATAGLVEEIFFRALPLLFISERFPQASLAGSYVAVTALLFGAAHWENGSHEFVATFVYGLFASFFYLKLRDLWPLIGAHTLIDVWVFW